MKFEHLIVRNDEKEETLDPAFREEIKRRVKEIDSGKEEGVDPFQALKGM